MHADVHMHIYTHMHARVCTHTYSVDTHACTYFPCSQFPVLFPACPGPSLPSLTPASRSRLSRPLPKTPGPHSPCWWL